MFTENNLLFLKENEKYKYYCKLYNRRIDFNLFNKEIEFQNCCQSKKKYSEYERINFN